MLKTFAIFIIFLSGCTTTLIRPVFQNHSIDKYIYKNSKIETTYTNQNLDQSFVFFSIEKGNNLVFYYRESLDTHVSLFTFQIPESIENNFTYKNRAILNTLALSDGGHYHEKKYNSWEYYHIIKGVIKGKKINETSWKVSIDVKIGAKKIKIKDIFVIAEYKE